MERSAGIVKLFQKAQKLAREMGVEIEESLTGGGSDGNFTAALGVPTLDGLGAVGEGAHAAEREHSGRPDRGPDGADREVAGVRMTPAQSVAEFAVRGGIVDS